MDVITYAMSKKYTDDAVAGGGAVKGKNCIVESITDITGGHRVTFQWTLDNGTVQTDTMDVMDGATGSTGATGPAGVGIASIDKTGTSGIVDTYTITYTNGDTDTFNVTNAVPAGTYLELAPSSATTYTFTDSVITASSRIFVFTDTYGDNPSNVVATNGSCVVTFLAAQTRTVGIEVR